MKALVARRVLVWTGLVTLLVAGIGLVGGLVEHADKAEPIERVLRDLPALLVMLSPLVMGIGAGLARARMMSAGEDLALGLCGFGLPHTAPVVAAIGLLLGGVAWSLNEGVVTQRPTSAPTAWVWLDGAGVRVADGLRVQVHDGSIRLDTVQVAGDAAVLAAMQRIRPETAPLASLLDDASPAVQVERHRRCARVVGCVLLALVGWWPVTRRPTSQIGWVVVIAVVTQVTDLVVLATTCAGHLTPWIGGWVGWAIPVVGLSVAGVRERYFAT